MKNILLGLLGAITLSGFMSSCKEDFDVAAPYKNVNIIYSMLNAADTAHYVRIQKAFMDQDKSAIDMAKVSDSSFYDEGVLDVKIKEFNSSNTLLKTIQLKRVDMNAEGYPKAPGEFFTSPNYAYKFTDSLNRNYTYRLVVRNTITGDVDSAETPIMGVDTVLDVPGNFRVYDFGGKVGTTVIPSNALAFPRTQGIGAKYKLTVIPPYNTKLLEGVIRFHYAEKNLNTNQQVDKYADFPFAKTVVTGSDADLEVPNIDIYYFLANALGTPPANTYRYLDSCDIYVYASSDVFYEYLTVTQAQTNTITSNEIKPLYTNIKGNDVIGFFTTRAVRVGKNIPIAGNTLDSLYFNPITSVTGLQPEPSDH